MVVLLELPPRAVAHAWCEASIRNEGSRPTTASTSRWPMDHDARGEQNAHAAGAELAACVAVGGWWQALGGVHERDVRLGCLSFEVRWSSRPDAWLITYTNNDPDAWYVLATGHLPRYALHGAAHGRAVMVGEPCTRFPNGAPMRAPAWLTAQRDLVPFEDFAGALWLSELGVPWCEPRSTTTN